MSRFFCFAWTAKTRSTIKVLFMLYLVSGLESESELESESQQPHHDSAPLYQTIFVGSLYGECFVPMSMPTPLVIISIMLFSQTMDNSMKQILEGQLSKYTNVMKGWQYRWFVLNPETGTLTYYMVSSALNMFFIE